MSSKTMDSIRPKPLGVTSAPQKIQIRQAHISRMPPELLASIFKFDLDAQRSPRKLRSGARLSRIISLSSVCSRWRTVALETSSFWTCIPLHLDNSLVTACVVRAGNKPLEVTGVENFDHIDIAMPPDPDEPWPGEGALADHTHKIHSLVLVTHTLHRIHPVIRWTLEPRVPYLRELSVTVTKFSTAEHRLNAILFESSESRVDALARQLYTLSLKRAYVNWMGYSFNRLRVLKLSSIGVLSIRQLRHIAATSPMLEVLELTSVELGSTRAESHTAREPLAFPNIRTLRLSYVYSLRFYADVLSKGKHSTELVVDTFGLEAGTRSLNFVRFWDTIEDMKETLNKLGYITLLGIGRNTWSNITRDRLMRTVVQMLPGLVTLRFEKLKLDRAALADILDATRWSRQVKTVQMKRVSIMDAKAFKFVIDRVAGSVKQIELIECWYVGNGTKVLITPGTLSHERSNSAPKIVFLEE